MAVKGFADTDLERLVLHGRKLDANVRAAVLDATINRQIEGPSTLTFSFLDSDRKLIRSRLFNQRVVANINDLRFEFVGYNKSGDILECRFEAAGWAALRRHTGPLAAGEKTTTRTRFAHRLVRAVPYLKFVGEPGDPNLVRLAVGKTERFHKALLRLAQEIHWRCFEDEGTIYFGSDKWLANLSKVRMISEDDDGIDYIDPQYDGRKRATSCSVTCRASRWAARPGAPIKIDGLGLLAGQGEWIVQSLSRSLFFQQTTVQHGRKTPALPEPKPDEPERHDDTGGRAALGQGGSPGRASTSGWQWPVTGSLTSPFGDGRDHQGIDIDGETGDPIRAAKAGIVTHSYYSSSYGNVIYLAHEGGFESRYAHLSARLVGAGQRVERSTVIGRMGSTGRSTGSHLHFEIRKGGTAVDPMSYLP